MYLVKSEKKIVLSKIILQNVIINNIYSIRFKIDQNLSRYLDTSQDFIGRKG